MGMPAKFKAFRDIQGEMAGFALYGPTGDPADLRRFTGIGAAPGAGKSLLAHIVGKLMGRKYAVLTATRSLEDQQVRDRFEITNIRGRQNYLCKDYSPLHPEIRWQCDEGEEKQCPLHMTPLCEYGGWQQTATKDRIGILSNYSYWMHARSTNPTALQSLGRPIHTLICDEAHLIPNELSRFLGIWVSTRDLRAFASTAYHKAMRSSHGAEWGRVGEKWLQVLEQADTQIAARMSTMETEAGGVAKAQVHNSEYRRLNKVRKSLTRVLSLGNDGNWIWQTTNGGVKFDCIWPRKYAARYLWSGVEKVVLLSATLRPKGISLSGIQRNSIWFKEWPRVFKATLSPVYWVPTGRVGRRAGEAGLETMLATADRLYERWKGHKGIVHTPSYKLAEWMRDHSKFGRHMILNERGEATQAAEKYRSRKVTPDAPVLLVSPSFSTGWDFPDEQCDFQHIPKLPFADRSDPDSDCAV